MRKDFYGEKLVVISLIMIILTSLTLKVSVSAVESPSFYVYNVPYIRQGDTYWCGPASLTMILNYWGVEVTQDEVAAEVYNPQAHLTYISEMVAYPERLGFKTEPITGSISQLKSWISRGRPLIVLQKLSLSDTYGHFRVVVGYDDEEEVVVTNDPYMGKDYNITYTQFASLWQPGETFSTYNWTLVITPQNDVLAGLMENNQRLRNQLPSLDYEKAVKELDAAKSTLNIFIAVSIMLTAYSSAITIIHLRQRRSVKARGEGSQPSLG